MSMFRSLVSRTAEAACAMTVAAASAGTAIWQGGATGDINDPDNWNGGANIAADFLNFGQDVTATVPADTTAYNLFGNKKDDADFANRTVVFNMGGHTLWATHADGANKQYVVGNAGTTYLFTNGTFRCAPAGNVSKTNTIVTSGSSTTNMSIVAIGGDTELVSSFGITSHSRGTGLRVLNGAKACGASFGFCNPSEVKGGNAQIRFSGSCFVGASEYSYNNLAGAPPHGGALLVDDATLASADPSSKGSIYIGFGNYAYGNALVATNGATIATKSIYVGYGGVKDGTLYTSSGNTFKATGAGTTVTTPSNGGSILCGAYSSGNRFLADHGATIASRAITVGTGYAVCATSNNTFLATGAGTTVLAYGGDITCGNGGSGGSSGNLFQVENGAVLTNFYQFYVGSGAATNNAFRAGGAGTLVESGGSRFIVGGNSAASAVSLGNSAILEDGATMTNNVLWVNLFGSENTMSIRSGATVVAKSDVCLGGGSVKNNPNDCGARGRLEVVGEGTTLTCGSNFYIRNSTGDASGAQELFVGDGASVSCGNNGFYFIGDGNRVVLSNGTMTATNMRIGGITSSSVEYPATNTTFRIMGASASLTAGSAKNMSGTDRWLVGAPVFEFAIPEGGWASAPVVINQAFTIGGDTIIRIDAASARAFSNTGGGTVPLIRSGAATPSITADVAALTANASLPAGCSLKNEGGVLSAVIPPSGATLISFR